METKGFTSSGPYLQYFLTFIIHSYTNSIQSHTKKALIISILKVFALQFSAENGNEENPFIFKIQCVLQKYYAVD